MEQMRVILPIRSGKMLMVVMIRGEMGTRSWCCARSRYPLMEISRYMMISSTWAVKKMKLARLRVGLLRWEIRGKMNCGLRKV